MRARRSFMKNGTVRYSHFANFEMGPSARGNTHAGVR
jgi:hypothetical protein